MTFIDRILPAPVDGGFRMPDYWVWCGSVIQGDDNRHHMFAATADGPGGFARAINTWNMCLPIQRS